MFANNIVEFEARMDDWDEMQAVMAQVASGSPAFDGDGSADETQAQAEFDALDDSDFFDNEFCPMCYTTIDADTGFCPTCRELVR